MITLESILAHGYRITITPTTLEGVIVVKAETKRARLTLTLMVQRGKPHHYDVLGSMAYSGLRNDMRELARVFGIEL